MTLWGVGFIGESRFSLNWMVLSGPFFDLDIIRTDKILKRLYSAVLGSQNWTKKNVNWNLLFMWCRNGSWSIFWRTFHVNLSSIVNCLFLRCEFRFNFVIFGLLRLHSIWCWSCVEKLCNFSLFMRKTFRAALYPNLFGYNKLLVICRNFSSVLSWFVIYEAHFWAWKGIFFKIKW